MSAEELLEQVLQLPRQDRARVAEEVLVSLEESDEDVVAAAWSEELQRRSREVAEGRVEVVEWKTARREILSLLADRRARRAAS